jgi:CTP synthase (UTP-ammonia lyase)
VEVNWCSTTGVTQRILEKAGGFWIATGAPYKDMNRALEVVRFARERNVPCLGTCQGFMHIILEYAQAFLGIENPGHAEYDPSLAKPFISQLSCSLRGRQMKLSIVEDTRMFEIYGSGETTERYYCSYGINPEFVPVIKDGSIRVSGYDSNGEIRIVEYPDHPFMAGTLFVPQARSTADDPHPVVSAFIQSVFAAK